MLQLNACSRSCRLHRRSSIKQVECSNMSIKVRAQHWGLVFDLKYINFVARRCCKLLPYNVKVVFSWDS